VTVVDVDNGARFETYAIAGERGGGEVKLNGAAARLVARGDTVIVISYAQLHARGARPSYRPRVVHVDATTRSSPSTSRSAARVDAEEECHVNKAERRADAGSDRLPMTLPRLAEKKRLGEPIVMITAYDFPSGQIAEEAGVDIVLVGDSAAEVVLGYGSTVPVSSRRC
jgi:hypothetical protein